jgi:NADH:ubiquinone oxidoreductase subunit 6 (subunit J)
MDLVPMGEGAGHGHEEHAGHAEHAGGASESMQMDAGAHHQMMVDMAMSTEQLPWALGLGALVAVALSALVLWTRWPAAPRAALGAVPDATTAVGSLLMSKYMMAFEGAAMLILAGIAGGVILGRRETSRTHGDGGAAQ